MKSILTNWKTSLGGILGLLLFGAAQAGVEIVNIADWGEAAGFITVAFSQLFGRDNDVTSEEAGADRASKARSAKRGG